MSQRVLGLFVAFSLLFASIPVFPLAAAQNVSSAGQSVQSDSDYSIYLQKQSSFSDATGSQVVTAADFALNSGAKVTRIDSAKGSGRNAIRWSNSAGSLIYNVDVSKAGFYTLGFLYRQIPGNGNDIELSVEIDGQTPYSELEDLKLPRLWKNKAAVGQDENGNEIAPEQVEAPAWQLGWAQDSKGIILEPLKIGLTAGRHQIQLNALAGAFELDSLELSAPARVASYASVESAYQQTGAADYVGPEVTVEGENAQIKNDKSLVPMSDTSSASVTPSNPYKSLINYIGSTNWETPGQELSWNIEIPKDGLYSIGFKYRQSYLQNGNSYRTLKIDGKVPFEEAEFLAFPYQNGWSFKELQTKQSSPCKLYLKKGKHTLSLQVTMGPMADIYRRLQSLVLNIGDIYRNIVMITGNTPDVNRDYNLFAQIPNFERDLRQDRQELNELADQIEEINQSKGGSEVASLRNMAATMKRMLDYSYQAQDYKADFYNNYCSVSTWLYQMRNMPLDLDEILIYSPQEQPAQTHTGIFTKIAFSTQRLAGSFLSDYDSLSAKSNSEKELTLWLYWGRDQVQVLYNMIKDTFTPETGIDVHIKIVNASLIQAILSGNGPDCSLQLSRSQPINLAMRGALYDLKNYPDFDQVTKRFQSTGTLPYQFENGCYALPDTQVFNMLFYRTDIFKQLGLKVPATWNDFIKTTTVLERYNMQVGLPYTQITDMTQTDLGVGALNLFPTLLEQNRTPLYNSKLTATNLTSAKATQVFTYWTDFYFKYNLPLTYDFYNRFRAGLVAMAIQPYTMYSMLSVAAPEIDGRWAMAPIPGVQQADGSIYNVEAAGGTGAVILNQSQHKQEAWKFLKWWTSDETQLRYCSDVESILGVAARNPTSNVKAFSGLSWKKQDLQTLLEQWEKVQELPEVPGGYYVPRVIDQAFWNTVNSNQNAHDMLIKWSSTADQEIARKRQDYHVW